MQSSSAAGANEVLYTLTYYFSVFTKLDEINSSFLKKKVFRGCPITPFVDVGTLQASLYRS